MSEEKDGGLMEELLNSEPKTSGKVIVRRAIKQKKRKSSNKTYEVEVIPATVGVIPKGETAQVLRCAAYCRVSTDDEAQSSSYELQVQHYTDYINAHVGWTLVGVYADEGISGTQVKHREEFKRMIEDCKEGKIDKIFVKSISRFSRNVVDCLTHVRLLKALNPPVEVYFEKENLSSLDDKTEMVLSIMSSVAQEESRSISANIQWAIVKRMKNGTQKIPTACLLGYASDECGDLVIIEEEAETVRYIYKSFIQGIHPTVIANKLNQKGVTTVLGNAWSSNSVRNILANEKYCGDVLMQKTYTEDFLTHKSRKNNGEREQYYIADHHDAIVSRAVWDKAKELLEKMNYKNWKRRDQQRLIPLAAGVLKGFVTLSPLWKDVSVVRLEAATKKVLNNTPGTVVELPVKEQIDKESEESIMSDVLKGFEVIELEVGKSDAVMTVMGNMLKFNKPTAAELMFPAYVRMAVDAVNKQVAIQACTEKSKNSLEFSRPADQQVYAITVRHPAVIVAIRKLMPEFDGKQNLTFRGKLFPDEKVIIFDLKEGEPVKKRNYKKKGEEAQEEQVAEKASAEGQASTADKAGAED